MWEYHWVSEQELGIIQTEHSSLSFYFSKTDPDQIRSVEHVYGARADLRISLDIKQPAI